MDKVWKSQFNLVSPWDRLDMLILVGKGIMEVRRQLWPKTSLPPPSPCRQNYLVPRKGPFSCSSNTQHSQILRNSNNPLLFLVRRHGPNLPGMFPLQYSEPHIHRTSLAESRQQRVLQTSSHLVPPNLARASGQALVKQKLMSVWSS